MGEPALIVGFTGTRLGMTTEQIDTVGDLLVAELMKSIAGDYPLEAHSGDCIGADAQFHHLAHCLGYKTVGHLPKYNKTRAFCTYDEVREPLGYIERDRAIAAECDVLIATPDTAYEKMRSGTWTTVRYARSIGRPHIIVPPNGECEWIV